MAATGSTQLVVTPIGDKEILLTRSFDAPRELVWKHFTDPKLMEKWWGPRKYTTVIEKMDLRPGGKWRFLNRAADGTEFAFRGEFREIIPPEKLVWTFEYEGAPGHISVETMTLEERNGITTLTARSVYNSREGRDGMIASGMEGGARESYDRLEELLTAARTSR